MKKDLITKIATIISPTWMSPYAEVNNNYPDQHLHYQADAMNKARKIAKLKVKKRIRELVTPPKTSTNVVWRGSWEIEAVLQETSLGIGKLTEGQRKTLTDVQAMLFALESLLGD